MEFIFNIAWLPQNILPLGRTSIHILPLDRTSIYCHWAA